MGEYVIKGIVIIAVLIFVGVLVIHTDNTDEKITEIAMKNGYCQKVVDNKKIWVKCSKKSLNR